MRCRFKNMDKMIHYANADGRVNVFYSSPDAYTAAKNSYDASWPLKTDDFFPYADCSTCYWTGLALYQLVISPRQGSSACFADCRQDHRQHDCNALIIRS